MRHSEYNVPCAKKIPLSIPDGAMLSICAAISGAIGTFIPENSMGTTENYLSKNSQHQCA